MAPEVPILLHSRFEQKFERSDQPIEYDPPIPPLEIEDIHTAGGLEIPQEDLELLLGCAKWEVCPPFHGPGRSAWVVCHEPLVSSDPSHTVIRAFKMKGIGAFGHDGKAHPPRSSQFFQGRGTATEELGRRQILIHMGINDDGSFKAVLDPSRPVGGMRFSRAAAEFENAVCLFHAGVSAVRPVAYGKYRRLTWENEPLGFVILAGSSRDPMRIGDLFEPPRSEDNEVTDIHPYLKAILERRFDVLRPGRLGFPLLKIIGEMEEARGKALRGFHNAGLVRFAGHTGNFSYDFDSRIATLHDLDSSVPLESLAPNARGLSILRDLDSALFGFIHSLIHAEIYKMANRETFDSQNPFTAFLAGYFGNKDKNIERAGRIILQKFRHMLETMPHYGTMEWYDWFGPAAETFTVEVIQLLMPIFSQSPLGTNHPLPYGPGKTFRDYFEQFRIERIRVQQEEGLRRAPVLTALDVEWRIRQMLEVGRR